MFRASARQRKLLDTFRGGTECHGVARILVIDDEPMVGLMIRRMLSPPHDVTTKHSGRSALEQLRGGDRYDVIVTDLHMADGDGIWLRGEVAKIDPEAPRRMLFLTGGAGSADAREFLDQPGVRWIEKPFRSAELIAAIGEILLSGS
jgi:CheY-like chemotaxis protein